MTQIPKPTVEEACALLRERDEFRIVLQYIRDERERFFGDLRHASTSDDVMKVAGSVATLDELLNVLS